MPFLIEADCKRNTTLLRSNDSQYFKMCHKFISDSSHKHCHYWWTGMSIFTVIQCTSCENPQFFQAHIIYEVKGVNLLCLHSFWILFNQTHHVDDVTDVNTHEQPQGRQHRLTPHLPSLEPALTASCFVCLVKVPLHILRQGHALPVGCL